MHVNKYVSRETLSYECSPWLEAWVGSRTASHHWINLTIFYPSIRFCPQFPLLCSNLGFRFMHTTVEGPVLWFRKNVVEAARTGEVNILLSFMSCTTNKIRLISVSLQYTLIMCRCSNPCGITVSSSGSPPLRSVMSPTWPAGKTLRVDFAVVSDDCIKTLMPDSVIWRRYEANQQFLRDWAVEAEMLGLLRFAWAENLSHQRKHCTTSGRGWMTASSTRRALVLLTCKHSRWEQAEKVF